MAVLASARDGLLQLRAARIVCCEFSFDRLPYVYCPAAIGCSQSSLLDENISGADPENQPKRQACVDLHFRQTRSPAHALLNVCRHIRHFLGIAVASATSALSQLQRSSSPKTIAGHSARPAPSGRMVPELTLGRAASTSRVRLPTDRVNGQPQHLQSDGLPPNSEAHLRRFPVQRSSVP